MFIKRGLRKYIYIQNSEVKIHQQVHQDMSRDMKFSTMWYVRPAKAQTSLRIHAVWSEPLLVAWTLYDC